MSNKIACGFVQDAVKLVKAFAEEKNFDLNAFSVVWKKLNFSMIFLGRRNEKELLEYTRQIFRITLELFFENTENIYEHVGYLYLLFGLFRYQLPIIKPPIKVRVTLEHFDRIEKLRNDAEQNRNIHILFAIRYLICDGFDFIYSPTLMGPYLASHATYVNLSTEPPPLHTNDSFDLACKMQEDLETCFEELKIIKTDYEKGMKKLDLEKAPYAVTNNIPFQAFMDALEPYTPGSSTKGQDSVGNRRALIKVAAYNRLINRVKRSVSLRGRNGKARRPRKFPEDDKPTKIESAKQVVPAEPERRGGQKQERLFKKKYRFLEYEPLPKSSSSPRKKPATQKKQTNFSVQKEN
ncbi:uncharacterized protein LOC129217806 [Uloborus diversus]|uniref:uncharacterized protein LOC129217806 n=1 Tax=Uloborus diversus TaxID=327109 RepID=UPI00240988C2|nr:uncharacterized protein LOC129217806 [Uloborus diversus]